MLRNDTEDASTFRSRFVSAGYSCKRVCFDFSLAPHDLAGSQALTYLEGSLGFSKLGRTKRLKPEQHSPGDETIPSQNISKLACRSHSACGRGISMTASYHWTRSIVEGVPNLEPFPAIDNNQ